MSNCRFFCASILLFSFAALPVCMSKEFNKGSKVALLGESYSSDNGSSGINEEVLGQLFTLIRDQHPEAVIFTGNMTLGIPPPQHQEGDLSADVPVYPLTSLDIKGKEKGTKEVGYSSSYFYKQLEAFLELKNRKLGKETPFYPLIGLREVPGADAASQLLALFKVKSEAPRNASPLAYTFALNNALFILISTADYQLQTDASISHQLNSELLQWLDVTLKANRGKYDFAFVVGSEPAFSTTVVAGSYQGLDNNEEARNQFWKILVKYRVNAYFCSGEHLYDRTNRYGIWQVISGGAGAPLYRREFDKAFYHYLLLSIPSSKEGVPKIQVYDPQGKLFDEFDLKAAPYPVYQLRISSSGSGL